jgi:hypothetical protein
MRLHALTVCPSQTRTHAHKFLSSSLHIIDLKPSWPGRAIFCNLCTRCVSPCTYAQCVNMCVYMFSINTHLTPSWQGRAIFCSLCTRSLSPSLVHSASFYVCLHAYIHVTCNIHVHTAHGFMSVYTNACINAWTKYNLYRGKYKNTHKHTKHTAHTAHTAHTHTYLVEYTYMIEHIKCILTE